MSTAENVYSAPAEHARLAQEVTDGTVAVSISRSIARQFYTMTPLAEIKSKTGHTELLAKLLVWSGLLVTPVLFTLSALLIIYYYGWWAAINIPLAGILWSVIAGFLNPTGSWVSVSAALALCAAVAAADLAAASLAATGVDRFSVGQSNDLSKRRLLSHPLGRYITDRL